MSSSSHRVTWMIALLAIAVAAVVLLATPGVAHGAGLHALAVRRLRVRPALRLRVDRLPRGRVVRRDRQHLLHVERLQHRRSDAPGPHLQGARGRNRRLVHRHAVLERERDGTATCTGRAASRWTRSTGPGSPTPTSTGSSVSRRPEARTSSSAAPCPVRDSRSSTTPRASQSTRAARCTSQTRATTGSRS